MEAYEFKDLLISLDIDYVLFGGFDDLFQLTLEGCHRHILQSESKPPQYPQPLYILLLYHHLQQLPQHKPIVLLHQLLLQVVNRIPLRPKYPIQLHLPLQILINRQQEPLVFR